MDAASTFRPVGCSGHSRLSGSPVEIYIGQVFSSQGGMGLFRLSDTDNPARSQNFGTGEEREVADPTIGSFSLKTPHCSIELGGLDRNNSKFRVVTADHKFS